MVNTIIRKILILLLVAGTTGITKLEAASAKAPVDYVNPYMGNISHLLVPTYPIVHLPNSMLRVYPQRGDYTSDKIHGLPLIQISHRGSFAFNLSPFQGDASGLSRVINFEYDNEVTKPYHYQVDLCNQQLHVEFAPSHQSAIYHFDYKEDKTPYLILNAGNGELEVSGNVISGYQNMWNNLRVYIYMETDTEPMKTGTLQSDKWEEGKRKAKGDNTCVVVGWNAAPLSLNVRYGVSYISVEQAKRNLRREIKDFDLKKVTSAGRKIWNEELGKISVSGGTENDRFVFYTSLYRCLERPVNISEEGRYFCVYDNRIHEDGGYAYYTDDWIWDSYRAAHPLRILTDRKKHTDIIRSFLRMSEFSSDHWFPNFPEVTGDSRRMNCNHGVSVIADAWYKGVRDFDLQKAYTYTKAAIEEKTLAPWSSAKAGWIDRFYKEKGYIPSLASGEQETVPEVNSFEKRQSVAVTLGTAYDQWCLSRIASALGLEKEADHYVSCSYNYRNLFNPQTSFFHPKDKDGRFLEPFDYRFSGGLGAREYYGENNGWIYRWDVQHNFGDLVNMMGGASAFVKNLDATFSEWLGKPKYEFYAQLPDHTGNVGQFSMANEPSLHIPYLYNYAQTPWKTQQRIRSLVHQWFRNDLMGVPGDEDGGGLSSFVVFSMMGFYPVTPGLPVYHIGSPFFSSVKMKLSNGKVLEIIARNCSVDNKYIQSAKLNGKVWSKPWFRHEDIENGGKLEFVMGNQCNTEWGASADDVPPSLNVMEHKPNY